MGEGISNPERYTPGEEKDIEKQRENYKKSLKGTAKKLSKLSVVQDRLDKDGQLIRDYDGKVLTEKIRPSEPFTEEEVMLTDAQTEDELRSNPESEDLAQRFGNANLSIESKETTDGGTAFHIKGTVRGQTIELYANVIRYSDLEKVHGKINGKELSPDDVAKLFWDYAEVASIRKKALEKSAEGKIYEKIYSDGSIKLARIQEKRQAEREKRRKDIEAMRQQTAGDLEKIYGE